MKVVYKVVGYKVRNPPMKVGLSSILKKSEDLRRGRSWRGTEASGCWPRWHFRHVLSLDGVVEFRAWQV